jgi:MOSC domain-containing protein YiiM
VRQFSAISLEEFTGIKRMLGAPAEPSGYGLLGENLIISGIPDFSALPPGTLLTFTRGEDGGEVSTGAVLAIWARNEPCRVPERNFSDLYGTDEHPFVASERFATAAKHRRGIVGSVYCAGTIQRGDTVRVWRPDAV